MVRHSNISLPSYLLAHLFCFSKISTYWSQKSQQLVGLVIDLSNHALFQRRVDVHQGKLIRSALDGGSLCGDWRCPLKVLPFPCCQSIVLCLLTICISYFKIWSSGERVNFLLLWWVYLRVAYLTVVMTTGCCTACAVRVKSGQLYQPQALGISAELKDRVQNLSYLVIICPPIFTCIHVWGCNCLILWIVWEVLKLNLPASPAYIDRCNRDQDILWCLANHFNLALLHLLCECSEREIH